MGYQHLALCKELVRGIGLVVCLVVPLKHTVYTSLVLMHTSLWRAACLKGRTLVGSGCCVGTQFSSGRGVCEVRCSLFGSRMCDVQIGIHSRALHQLVKAQQGMHVPHLWVCGVVLLLWSGCKIDAGLWCLACAAFLTVRLAGRFTGLHQN